MLTVIEVISPPLFSSGLHSTVPLAKILCTYDPDAHSIDVQRFCTVLKSTDNEISPLVPPPNKPSLAVTVVISPL